MVKVEQYHYTATYPI